MDVFLPFNQFGKIVIMGLKSIPARYIVYFFPPLTCSGIPAGAIGATIACVKKLHKDI